MFEPFIGPVISYTKKAYPHSSALVGFKNGCEWVWFKKHTTIKTIQPKSNSMTLVSLWYNDNRATGSDAKAMTTRTVSQITKDTPSHTNSYLLWSIFLDIFGPDNLPSCTSSGCIILLWKVSSILVHPFRRSCAHKTYGQTDRVISYTPHPNQRLCFQGGIKTQHLLDLSYYYYVPEVWYLRNGLCLQSTLSVQAGVRLLSLVS